MTAIAAAPSRHDLELNSPPVSTLALLDEDEPG